MRRAWNHLTIESLDPTETLLITITGRSYRSSEEEQLQSLRRELDTIDPHMESSRNVIVDLSQIEIFGSGLLRVLFDQLAPLRMLGIQAILCGDRHGLVVQTAIDRWITVTANRDAALAIVEDANVYEFHNAEPKSKISQMVCTK